MESIHTQQGVEPIHPIIALQLFALILMKIVACLPARSPGWVSRASATSQQESMSAAWHCHHGLQHHQSVGLIWLGENITHRVVAHGSLLLLVFLLWIRLYSFKCRFGSLDFIKEGIPMGSHTVEDIELAAEVEKR